MEIWIKSYNIRLGKEQRQQGQKAGATVLATQASVSAPKGVSTVKVNGRDPAHSLTPLRVGGGHACRVGLRGLRSFLTRVDQVVTKGFWNVSIISSQADPQGAHSFPT